MNFDYEGSYLLYNSGYDPGYSHLSVGLLNKALSIKDAVERGRESFEFLRGTERYKYDLGAQDRAIYRLTVHR
jgi:CelD/BcsL family acetyltransferase involved in cellulose biosynthesis